MKYLYKILLIATACMLLKETAAQLSGPIGFSLPANQLPSMLVSMEYYFDTDPGPGNGMPIAVTAGNDISVDQLTVPISALSTGVHRLFVRSKDISGLWSLTSAATLFISPQLLMPPGNLPAAEITAAECFFDADPGYGRGSPLPVTAGGDFVLTSFAVGVDSLPSGIHRLYTRVKNKNGLWSLTNVSNLYVVPAFPVLSENQRVDGIRSAEYFLDNDPGMGKGRALSVTEGEDISVNGFTVDITGLTEGAHRIYVRTVNTAGSWSITTAATFYIVPVSFSIPPNAPNGLITAVEYFFDADPGFGNGHLLRVTPTSDLSDYLITADISALKQDTTHTLYIRALDGWSQTSSVRFSIGATLPVKWQSFTARLQSGSRVLLRWQMALQVNTDSFQIERRIDGAIYEPVGRIAADKSVAGDYSFMDKEVPSGTIYYRIKELDKAGQFSYSNILSIRNSDLTGDGFYVINNPVRNLLRVHLEAKIAGGRLEVFDMNGRLILTTPVGTNSIQEIDVSRLASGLYFVRYAHGRAVQSQKFIKK